MVPQQRLSHWRLNQHTALQGDILGQTCESCVYGFLIVTAILASSA